MGFGRPHTGRKDKRRNRLVQPWPSCQCSTALWPTRPAEFGVGFPTMAGVVFPSAIRAGVGSPSLHRVLLPFQVDVSDGHGGSATGTLVLSAMVPIINVAPAMGIVYQSTASADVAEVVLLHASATDPEGQPLTWDWKASDGVLSDQVDRAGSSDLNWTAPATPGIQCTITATATDPGGASASFVFTVQVQGPGA